VALDLQSLTVDLRPYMLREIDSDLADSSFYLSPRLNEAGREAFPGLLREAAEHGTDEDLIGSLSSGDYFNATEIRQLKTGPSEAKVPSNAPSVLAEGEFNRIYLRGLCLRLVENGGGKVEVYRARESSWARPESEALIGTHIDAAELLADLRAHKGEAPTLLPHVNSGLSAREVDP